MKPNTRDPWIELRRHTPARIALGRSGGSTTTSALLDFRASHAAARDAVHAVFEVEELQKTLAGFCEETVLVRTQAQDRPQYLLRPDLGRCLAEEGREQLNGFCERRGPTDLVIIVSDGLSATAAMRQVPELLTHLLPALRQQGFESIAVVIAPFARVKIQDEIGPLLGARMSLVLLGERPGLGTPDSLGAYFTHSPCAACTDADRNCVSNIRAGGLPPAEAAVKLAQLLHSSLRLGFSGVRLKESHENTLSAA